MFGRNARLSKGTPLTWGVRAGKGIPSRMFGENITIIFIILAVSVGSHT